MNHLRALVAAPLAVTALSGCGRPASEPPARVLAFYYGWYGTPDGSGAWRHWNDGGRDPAQLVSGLPDIASAHHPAVGLYDSLDDATIRRHLQEAEAAGIDGFIASWWGADSFEDRSLGRLLDAIDQTGSKLRAAGYFEEVPGDDPSRGAASLATLLDRHAGRPGYLRRDGKPVVFVYGRAIFPGVFCTFETCAAPRPSHLDWSALFREARAGRSFLAVGDAISMRLVDLLPHLASDGFDGVHLYNPHLDVDLGADLKEDNARLVRFARSRGLASAATVIPGYDDRWAGRSIATITPRADGALFDALWSAALSAAPDWVLVTSFNEWHEGTEIEPSVELGDGYLAANRRNADRFKAR